MKEVEAEKKPRQATPSPSPASVFDVLDDENLLSEIIKRTDPASFVRAAVVSKKWYLTCSNTKFLDDFYNRQPRRLLGYFGTFESDTEFFLFKEAPEQAGVARFRSVSIAPSISLSQAPYHHTCVFEEAPELACVSRFLSSTFTESSCDVMDYCSGRVLVMIGKTLAICHPLHQKVSMLPPLLPLPCWRGDCAGEYFLFTEDGFSAVHVTVTWMVVGSLGIDCAYLNGNQWTYDSNSIAFEERHNNPFCHPAVLANGCVFMLTIVGCMVELNLEGCKISIVDLPSKAYYQWGSHHLCKAQSRDLIYVHADGYSIKIWLYSQDSWLLCNTINLPIVFACSNIPWTPVDWDESRSGWGEVITIYGAGDAAEFLFFGVGGIDGLYLLDVGSSTVVKVGEKECEEQGELIGNRIIPFITSFRPIFPDMRNDNIDTKRLEDAVVEGNKNLIDHLLAIPLDEKRVKSFIKTRYPSMAHLIWSIDDCLTMLHSVAALPNLEGAPELQHRIDSCRRLTRQWVKYIVQTKSLRKRVDSVNGVYFQAEVNGQTVTWRSPLATQVVNDCVGFNLNVNLLVFYENCMELLLESVNNTAGSSSKKRDAQLELIPNFQYSETIKRLRCVLSLQGR